MAEEAGFDLLKQWHFPLDIYRAYHTMRRGIIGEFALPLLP